MAAWEIAEACSAAAWEAEGVAWGTISAALAPDWDA